MEILVEREKSVNTGKAYPILCLKMAECLGRFSISLLMNSVLGKAHKKPEWNLFIKFQITPLKRTAGGVAWESEAF